MENKFTLILAFFTGSVYFAQVGINTIAPAATLDITAQSPSGTSGTPEGLLIPRVDRQKAQSMTGVAVSTMVFVANVSNGTQAGTALNIDERGYYYFDGNVWIKIKTGNSPDVNIYTANGSLADDRVVTQEANTLAFNSSVVNGFSVGGNTFSVDTLNEKVGIGTVAPNSSLQVLGGEMRVGGPASQTGSIPNPILRIHSNANEDGSGGELKFSENDTEYGYYLRHNTEDGNIYGFDGLAIGSVQPGKNDYNPARPGVFVSADQRVGFGTATPQQMLHVDGNRDNNINSAPTAAQELNDVVIRVDGNVGIGTIDPQAHLHVVGTRRFQDAGLVPVGSVLMATDTNGTAEWKTPSTTVILGGTESGTIGLDIPFQKDGALKYTGRFITLPPGKWIITITQLAQTSGALNNDDWMFVRSTFSEQNLAIGDAGAQSSNVNGGPALMSFRVRGPGSAGSSQQFDVFQGSIFINNNTGADKKYSYIVGNTEKGGSSTPSGTVIKSFGGTWSESSVYATAIN